MLRRGAASAATRFTGLCGFSGEAQMRSSLGAGVGLTPTRMSCGELRSCHVGSLVELAGSVQQSRMNRFFLLRDSHGATQLVVPDHRPDIGKRLLKLPLRSFISVIGWVMQRPPGAVNESMNTGKIEVSIQDLVMVRVNRDLWRSNKGITEHVRNMSTCSNAKSLTSEEYHKCGNSGGLLWKFRNRTDTCGGLNISEAERDVTLIGWLQAQHLPRFIKLKDGYGAVQCLLPSSKPELQEIIQNITPDAIMQIEGKIMARPHPHVNSLEENGDIEILVNSIEVLDPSIPAPENAEDQINSNAEEEIEIPNEIGVNTYTRRTHTCGELRPEHVGMYVTLCGWLQYCRMQRFIILRDSYGATQCLIPDENFVEWKINELPLESVIEVRGVVGNRPPSSVNMELATGAVEVLVDSFKLLNTATFLPLSIRSFNMPKEDLRMQHRYMYLRYPEMQKNLRLRSNMTMKMRKFLIDLHQFVEVETPTLFCRTPGGAQEFVVPTKHRGLFYSLIQSPQQHKQMLMAGGIDRYFQIARCYRDETTRGDRQPEFTQLDIEVSFTSRDEILSLVEDLFRSFWPYSLPPEPFTRITYKDALYNYGTDKPDISFDFKLQNLTEAFESKVSLRQEVPDFGAFAIIVPESMFVLTNNSKRSFHAISKKYPGVKLILTSVQTSVKKWCGSLDVLGENVTQAMASKLDLQVNDHVILAYGDRDSCCWCLGDIRKKLGQEAELSSLISRSVEISSPLWVVDFPLFIKGKDGLLETCHHPFTAPHPDDTAMLETEPLQVRSLAYDLVLMGNEVGGGSVRVHDSSLQRRLLDMLNISSEPLQHLMHALECGCPPHAGIALGLDRLVALACKADTIRDVIAFPKSHEGRDPLTGAPSALNTQEQNHYHIRVSDSEYPNAKRLHVEVQ